MQEREEEDRKIRRCPTEKKGGGREKLYVCGSEDHLVHKYCGLCRGLEHLTRDCEERGTEKSAMLAKTNVPASAEVGLVAATTGAARGDGKVEWDSVTHYVPYTGRNNCLQEGACGDDRSDPIWDNFAGRRVRDS